MDKFCYDEILENAFKEDMPNGDITTDILIDKNSISEAVYIAKEEGIIAGIEVAKRTFELLDEKIDFETKVNDGERVNSGDIIAIIKGNTGAMLKAERTALNILQRMSGIATKTREMVDAVEGYKAKIVDTRKTMPGIRILDKYAVRIGGGENHRFGLSDGVLIKDNHISACGGIKEAVKKAKENVPHTIKVEVEVESIEGVKEALEAKADIIMLDNMEHTTMTEAVNLIDGKSLVEASGNVTTEKVKEIAKTGVDIISSGALTHSVKALDISMRFR